MRYGIYDAPSRKSYAVDRTAVLDELRVHEVVLMVEPMWRAPWKPFMLAEQMVGRTQRIKERVGCSVVWGFTPKRTTHYFRAVQGYLEAARTNAAARDDENAWPDGIEWVNPGEQRFRPPIHEYAQTKEEWMGNMRRWLWGSAGKSKPCFELNLQAAFFGAPSPSIGRVYRAWSSTNTMLPAYYTQVRLKKVLRPSDVVCLTASGQAGVGLQHDSKSFGRHELDVEDALDAALLGAQQAGAHAVRWWRLQDMVDADGALSRAGVWLRAKCRRAKGVG